MSLPPERPSSVASTESRQSSLPQDDQRPLHSESESEEPHETESEASVADDESDKKQTPLQRFIFRTLLLVIVPPAITTYFAVICWVYHVPDPGKNSYGHRNALWVYYSWFVIGVFGLGISQYGLAGVEAAMLEDRTWHARDPMELLLHSRQSWSGPVGWIRYLWILIYRRKSLVHRLWWLLGLLSLIVTIALPMSGLSMELFDGFVETSHQPSVIGYDRTLFDMQYALDGMSQGRTLWQVASSVQLPGVGIAYTPQRLDRDKYSYLTEIPNSMSTAQDVPDLFLIPQAKHPVSGSTWGIQLSYNCSVVQSVSELTLLPNRSSLRLLTVDDFARLSGLDSSVSIYNSTVENLFSYVELGYRTNKSAPGNEARWTLTTMEYVMWQVRVGIPYQDNEYPFNSTIDTPVSDIGSPLVQHANGTFVPNSTFLEIAPSSDQPNASPNILQQFVQDGRNATDLHFFELAQPIGVQCRQFSQGGTAKINPDKLTFSDFKTIPPEDMIIRGEDDLPIRTVLQLDGPYSETILADLLSSIKKRRDIRSMYPEYLQAAELQESLMRLYGHSALQLMYNGLDTFDAAEVAENLTASKPGKVLGPGPVPPLVPAIMLGIWALGCVLLGLQYGFRPRRAETLDGYILLEVGAEYAKR